MIAETLNWAINMQRTPMTVAGEIRLREELTRRKQKDRPRIVQAIAEARAHGDLKENAEYHAAREQQSFNEGRIAEIDSRLAGAQVIDITKLPDSGKVIFGTTVTVLDSEQGASLTYTIVGEDEADVTQGKISYTSPIARGLIGKEEGDEVSIQTPSGITQFEIEEVQYI